MFGIQYSTNEICIRHLTLRFDNFLSIASFATRLSKVAGLPLYRQVKCVVLVYSDEEMPVDWRKKINYSQIKRRYGDRSR